MQLSHSHCSLIGCNISIIYWYGAFKNHALRNFKELYLSIKIRLYAAGFTKLKFPLKQMQVLLIKTRRISDKRMQQHQSIVSKSIFAAHFFSALKKLPYGNCYNAYKLLL